MSRTEMIVIIQASLAGKEIQCRVKDDGALSIVKQTACACKSSHQKWSTPCNNPPAFSFGLFDYRIKQ